MNRTDLFESLAIQHRSRLINQAMVLCQDHDMAEDLVQMTLIKAQRHFDTYDTEKSSFINWTLRILQRTFIDEFRSKKRRNEVSIEAFSAYVQVSDDVEFDCEDINADTEAKIIQLETMAAVNEMIDRLPVQYAEALRLCFIEGESYESIAEKHNTTIGTVRSRIHRARKMLAEQNAEHQVVNL